MCSRLRFWIVLDPYSRLKLAGLLSDGRFSTAILRGARDANSGCSNSSNSPRSVLFPLLIYFRIFYHRPMSIQTREYHRAWREAHKDRIREYYKRDYLKRRDSIRKKRSTRTYRAKLAAYLKIWRERNASKIKMSMREWTAQNRDHIKNYKRAYAARRRALYKKRRGVICARKRELAKTPKYRKRLQTYLHARRKSDIQFSLKDRLRATMNRSLRRQFARKSARTFDLIGCSPSELRTHIERLFLPGMSWANRNLWHVDHKRPLALFDLTDPAQQREAFHFSNLQPLWAKDNQSKGARA